MQMCSLNEQAPVEHVFDGGFVILEVSGYDHSSTTPSQIRIRKLVRNRRLVLHSPNRSSCFSC